MDSDSYCQSFDMLISLSSKIFNSDHLRSCGTPEKYVDDVQRVLAAFDDSRVKHCCSAGNASSESRRECSRRLIVLSSLDEIFKQSSKTCELFDSITGDVNSASWHQKKAPQNHDNSNNCAKRENVISTPKVQLVQNNDENRRYKEEFYWYNDVASLLLEKDYVIKLMSNCVFTAGLAKKVVVTCVKSNPDKICVILQGIESLLAQSFEENLRMFDLLLEFMSKQNVKNHITILERTYTWFTSFYEGKHVFSVKGLMREISVKRDEWTKLISFLSFTKNIIKYGNSHGKDVQPYLLHDILEVLMNLLGKSVTDRDCLYQPVLLKIIKIFNMALNFDIVLRKDVIPKPVLEVAVQILKSFCSLFTSLSNDYFSMNKLFWGKEHSEHIQKERNPYHVSCSMTMTRLFLVLSLKSCLFSKYSNTFDDADIKGSTHKICDTFRMWFLQKHNAVLTNSEWLPALLGEDDNHWITVLLCLLLIHIYLNEKKKKQVLPSQVLDQNQCLEAVSASCHMSEPSPSPSSCDKQCTFSIFHDRLCPHRLFVQFVNFIAFDHLVLADFLMSPETNFLAYFTKYITLLNEEWEDFHKNYDAYETIFTERNQSNASSCHIKPALTSITSTHSGASNSLVVLHSSSATGPYSSLPFSQTHLTASNTFQRVNESMIEPSVKKVKLTRTFVTPCHMSDQNAVNGSHESVKGQHTLLSSLVSYSDSEDSDHDNLDVDFGNKPVKKNEIPSYYYSSTYTCSDIRQDGESDRNMNDKKKIFNSAFNYNSKDMTLFLDCQKSTNDRHTPSDSITDDEEQDSNDSDTGSETVRYEHNTLERFMTMLIRLHFHIDRLNDQHLIPYKANLLLKLLNACIEKYESDESTQ